MSSGGFIKLHRGWMDSPAFKDEPYCQRAAWSWLLEKAAWKDGERRDPYGCIVKVKRGQIHTSTRTLGQAWGWSKNKVSRFLSDLEKCQMVDHSADRAGVLLTICNYEKYQGERTTDGPRTGPRTDHGRTTQEERKERKEERNRGLARPDDVSSDVWGDFLKLRNARKAPVTQTALNTIQTEAGKVNWTLERALTECVARGWQGFKSDWVKVQAPAEEFTGPC